MKHSSQRKISLEKSSVLLLGNYRPTLVIAKYLKSQGCHVVSGYEGCDRGAEHSKYVDEIWNHYPAEESSVEFIRELKVFLASRPDIRLVIPVSEIFVRIFSENTPALPENVIVAMNDRQIVNACLDKFSMTQLAQSLAVPVAPFQSATDLTKLYDAVEDQSFPVVVRPMGSDLRLFGRKAVTLESLDCLRKWFSVWPEEHKKLLVQAKAPGIRHNIYFAAKDGDLTKYLHTRIDRTDRLDGSGLAVEGVSVDPDPELKTYTTALIRALDYTGIGCAQYLVDQHSGDCIFLEINSRIAGNHLVPEFCGLNLTGFMIDLALAVETNACPVEFGTSGVRYSWFIGDLEGLKLAIRKREIGIRGALNWLVKSVTAVIRSDVDMRIDFQDLKPGLIGLIKVLPGFSRLPGIRVTASLNNRIVRPTPMHHADAKYLKSH